MRPFLFLFFLILSMTKLYGLKTKLIVYILIIGFWVLLNHKNLHNILNIFFVQVL